MSKIVTIGVDQAVNHTGIAVLIDGRIGFVHGWTQIRKLQQQNPDFFTFFKLPANAGHDQRVHRLSTVGTWVMNIVRKYLKKEFFVYVALEGYALNQRSNRASDTFELGGIIRSYLWQEGVPFRIYTPQAVKKAWTGSGNASKSAMQMECFKRFNVDFTKYGDDGENLADALLIASLLDREIRLRKGGTVEKEVEAELRAKKKKLAAALDRPFIFYVAQEHREAISAVPI